MFILLIKQSFFLIDFRKAKICDIISTIRSAKREDKRSEEAGSGKAQPYL